jgi:lipopolysaccharide/colanic/teichoic acid biosynthesis glycosyltransferase
LDIGASLLFLLFYPIFIFIVKNPLGLLINLFYVLFGKYSWVGYYQSNNNTVSHLPKIKSGILTPVDVIKNLQLDEATTEKLNLLYAKDYHLNNDLNILFKGFRNIGRKV